MTDWKNYAHYGVAILAMLVGGISELGIQLPGVVVSDPKMTFGLGLGVLVAGLKGPAAVK